MFLPDLVVLFMISAYKLPEKEEDLLIEHVDHEHALDCVTMYVAQYSHLQ